VKHSSNKSENDFLASCRDIDFSAESQNFEKNLEDLKDKLLVQNNNNEEHDIMMKNTNKRNFRKPSFAIAACMAAIIAISVPVFGQDVVNYIRSVMLGDHVTFIVAEEMSEAERAERLVLIEEAQALIDEGYVIVSEQDFAAIEWLSFTNAAEGKSHFITDVMLPTYAPEGFAFDHVFYFVETVEELQQYGANMFMGVIFTDGTNEVSMQIRYMTEDTGFVTGGTEDLRTIDINGHEAVVDVNALNVLIGDVMYMFFSQGNVDEDALIRMAESLQ